MTGVFMKRATLGHRHAQREGMATWEARHRETEKWSDVPTSPGMPVAARSKQRGLARIPSPASPSQRL